MPIISRFGKRPGQLGDLLDFEKADRKIKISFENGRCETIVYANDLIRLRISDDELEEDFSYAVIKSPEDFEEPEISVESDDEKISISTSRVRLEIDRSPVCFRFYSASGGKPFLEGEEGYSFCREGDAIRTFKKIRTDEHFYGFGEKTGPLDKRGERMQMRARDMFYRRRADPIYISIPFFLGISKGKAYGIFFDNTYRSHFDMGRASKEIYSFGADGGELNYYVFYGPEISRILQRYTELTGRMKMPPKWAIGYHQSRFSYAPEEKVLEIAKNFREREIPCDAIFLDIDYMNSYKVFTFDGKKFPDPKGMIQKLKEWGFNVVAVVDPGIAEDENFPIYRECVDMKSYCRNPEGNPAKGWSWPRISIFPDFTRPEVRKWWGDLHKFYFDLGIEGIWNDMNEPALLPHPLNLLMFSEAITKNFYLDDFGRNSSLKKVRNVYALNENMGMISGFEKHMPERRPFILTRSGYAGIQRYAAVWTGDNWSTFDQIGLSVRMIMNLGLSGLAFAGADIGGFSGILKIFVGNSELYKRWIQTGAFYPFSRTHTMRFTRDQEPWSYGLEVEEVSRRYIGLRYQLLPYLYSLFWEASKTGSPIMRPMFFNYQGDEMCYNKGFENQFMLGEDLLIVPISGRNVEEIGVYLPGGENWIHFWSENRFDGGKVHRVKVSPMDIPIFVRGGAIIPMQRVTQNTKEEVSTLNVHSYPGEGSFTLYNDDGLTKDYMKGKFCTVDFNLSRKNSSWELKIDKDEGEYELPYENYKFVFHTGQDSRSVRVDGKEIGWIYDEISKSVKLKTTTEISEVELLF